ncbi:hypothetical protein GGI15_000570 [Coemansia interrupta]|uniref:Uncharacterized protein n=1 Tax=Coemansia interrupta TaxID=1126814 RepID=A0A9W8HK32_9FUNG|nr:hypothetical protein GGI15_000570 [Coemansia interrupta]
MKNIKRLLIWWARHTGALGSRRRRRQQQQGEQGTPTTPTQPRRLFGRRAAVSLDTPRMGGAYAGSAAVSTETLVDDKQRARALSDPAISLGYEHVYSYFPWSEAEHEAILQRSPPPPLRPHYATFPSLVEMGGFMSL